MERNIAFDQFQRYKNVQLFVDFYRAQAKQKIFHILEIGANVHKNLDKFLPSDKITYADIELPPELINDPQYFIADATDLYGLADSLYDIVVAVDVFEHIALDQRDKFVKELSRVCKYAVIFCFPFDAPHVVEAESRANEYFRAISNQDYRWLMEHAAIGLPSRDNTDAYIRETGYAFYAFEHGSVDMWETMMKAHFYSCFTEQIIPYRLKIDDYYNRNIFYKDKNCYNYRAFYVVAKEEGAITAARKTAELFQGEISEESRRFIERGIEDLIHICELRMKRDLEAQSMLAQQQLPAEQVSSIYWDLGDGFNEKNRELRTYLLDDQSHLYSEEIHFPQPVGTIRFDPLEGKSCIVKNLQVFSSCGAISCKNINGFQLQDYDVFLTKDPQFLLVPTEPVDWIKIEAQIFPYDEGFLLGLFSGLSKVMQALRAEMQEANNQIKSLQTEYYLSLTETRHDLGRQCQALQAELQEANDQIKSLQTEYYLSLTETRHDLERQCQALQAELQEANDQIKSLQTEYDVLRVQHESLLASSQSMGRELGETRELLSQYQTAYHQTLADLENTQAQLSRLLRSTFWRATKPLRVVCDGIKFLLKRVPGVRLCYKGLTSIRHFGIRETLHKVKNKLKGTPRCAPVLDPAPLKAQYPPIEETILFSVVIPLFNTPLNLLEELIESIQAQNYRNWELCLADGSTKRRERIQELVLRYAALDSRIRYLKLDKNLGISGNTNAALEMANGDYIVLADHDDILAPTALYENAVAIRETGADILYSDEDHMNQSGKKHFLPLCKPDWSPDLLHSQMYVCHLLTIKRGLLQEIGGFDSEYDGSQDYDLLLRLSERTDRIYHIPKILYSWREVPTSTSVNADSKPYAQDAGLRALSAHLKRKYGNQATATKTEYPFVYQVRWDTLIHEPRISIIIPMKDKAELTAQCIESIIEKSTYRNWEIIIVNNRSIEHRSYTWFQQITDEEPRVKVVDADFDFNWSKVNNLGIRHSTGDAFIFLNNDTVVITADWMERLCEQAFREEIGVVGPLLLFEDGTIQHAGIVVGMGGWADHIYRGTGPSHTGSPYISPMVSRNVLAVTGACLCVSRRTIEAIGNFDEGFVICGSDVELCLRAYNAGKRNLYNANVRLYHLESKSRDSHIPEVDFQLSWQLYEPYRENIDPYFNPNLDVNSVIPTFSPGGNMNFKPFVNFLQRNSLAKKAVAGARKIVHDASFSPNIAEVVPINPRVDTLLEDKVRLNLLVPSINTEHVFGGISTALQFFETLCSKVDADVRIIITDTQINLDSHIPLEGYEIVSMSDSASYSRQVVSIADRYGKTLSVGKQDLFVTTGWWTAYTIIPVIQWQENAFGGGVNPLIYLIQDYEPGFYPWSSRYLMADSTYRGAVPTIAVFNSQLLYEYFQSKGYSFLESYFFDPVLNTTLQEHLAAGVERRKKQVLMYGRPSVPRNAFELVVEGLSRWAAQQPDIAEWEVLSVGEDHPDVELPAGKVIHALGKLTLEEYAKLMKETYMAVSLMVSPHPSYPPLEMSTFGIRTITNCYATKDLDSFNPNIISLQSASAQDIAQALGRLAQEYPGAAEVQSHTEYACADGTKDMFSEICYQISKSQWLTNNR